MREVHNMHMYYIRNNMQLPLIVHKILYEDMYYISQKEAQELTNAKNAMKAHIKLTKLLVDG